MGGKSSRTKGSGNFKIKTPFPGGGGALAKEISIKTKGGGEIVFLGRTKSGGYYGNYYKKAGAPANPASAKYFETSKKSRAAIKKQFESKE